MGALQPAHWLIILLVLFLVFGPRRIVRTGRALGESCRALAAGWRASVRPDAGPVARPSELPARACARCGVWSGDQATYCTRCGAPLSQY